MFLERESSVSLLDLFHGGVLANIEDCKWIEGLEGLDGHDHLKVLDPEVPEEGSNNELNVESFVENRGTGLSFLCSDQSGAPITQALTCEVFNFHHSCVEGVQHAKRSWE